MKKNRELDEFLLSLNDRIEKAMTPEEIRDIFTTLDDYKGSLERDRSVGWTRVLISIALMWLVWVSVEFYTGGGATSAALGLTSALFPPAIVIWYSLRGMISLSWLTANHLYRQAVALDVGNPLPRHVPVMRQLLESVVAHRVARNGSDEETTGLHVGTPGSRIDPEFVVFDFPSLESEMDGEVQNPAPLEFCDAIALPTRLRTPLKLAYPVTDEVASVCAIASGSLEAIEHLGEALGRVDIETDGSGLIVFIHDLLEIWPPQSPGIPLSDPVALRRAANSSEAAAELKAYAKALLGVVEALEGGSATTRPTLADVVASVDSKKNTSLY